jgi:tetratricopeptide (TPR) repeat protein
MRAHEVDGTTLVTNLLALKQAKRFRDIEEAIRAFLAHRRAKDPAPWLYEMLALSIEMNKGRPEDVKKALGYAADQAMRSQLPGDLTRVADELAMRQMYDRAGPLLDRAAELDPSSALPLWMSISLALRSKDPERMGSSVEKLLSLGWPGTDEVWRIEARKQVEALARLLREDDREAEAKTLLERLAQAETRDLVLRLTWIGDAGLDLVVEEPLGATARVLTPRTVFGGAIVKDGYGKHPEELYVCPRGFDGDYKVRVETLYNDEKAPVRQATLTIITHEGTDHEQRRTETIDLSRNEPVVVRLSGGRRKTVLPYQAPPPEPVAATPPAETKPARPSTPTPAAAADALRAPGEPAPKSKSARPASPRGSGIR